MHFFGLNEFIIFLSFLWLGMVFGITHYFVIQQKKKWLLISVSIISAFLVSLSFFVFVLELNHGVFRFYMLFGTVIGFAASFCTLGRLFGKIIGFCYNKIKVFLTTWRNR
ncbi:MAG: hypothetical protein FWD89_00430 [Firmicutes bacterium]|nr:hypothetical protein [Bacillota bacterium]MCL2770765.1 hypothetical protein [Bacillota bacterium]